MKKLNVNGRTVKARVMMLDEVLTERSVISVDDKTAVPVVERGITVSEYAVLHKDDVLASFYHVTSESFTPTLATQEFKRANEPALMNANLESELMPINGDRLLRVMRTTEIMVPLNKIPERFTRNYDKYVAWQRKWFFDGLVEDGIPNVKPGINQTDAMRHLNAIQRSFDTQHEHKQACVAYLASLWFEESYFDKYETSLMHRM